MDKFLIYHLENNGWFKKEGVVILDKKRTLEGWSVKYEFECDWGMEEETDDVSLDEVIGAVADMMFNMMGEKK